MVVRNTSYSVLFVVVFCFFIYSQCSLASETSHERVVVHGTKPDYAYHLADSLPLSAIDLDPLSQFGSAADALTQAPEVTFNGQGGLLQTLSIRGLSRWRIQTLVEGVPIHSERRAGNAAEFVAPGLLGRSYVLPGAASTQLGSGALGGGIDLRLASSFDTRIASSYGVQQDYRELSGIGGQQNKGFNVNWGVSYRHGNNSESANNQLLLDGFEQSVGWAKYTSIDSIIKEALFLYSTANNIGKASSDLPSERITEYPSNDHWLTKFTLNWFNTTVYAHRFSLDTDVLRPERRFNDLSNSGLSWGVSAGEQSQVQQWTISWKAALDARSKVEAQEQEFNNQGEQTFNRRNLAAEQKAYSFTIDANRQWQNINVSGGFRTEYIEQSNQANTQANTTDDNADTNLSAFLAARYQFNENWSTSLYTSSAFRVPVLTERYFNGSTPRGVTLGDPLLETERGRNLQIDVDYQSSLLEFGVSASRQWIDNYIERINISNELQQYVNLGNAQIEAINYLLNWSPTGRIKVRLSGQWLWGEDDTGIAINDISPHQHDVNITYQAQKFDSWIGVSYRQAFDKPGPSELALPSTLFMKLGATFYLNNQITVSTQINNLFDRLYSVSTDDLSPLARGRDGQISVTYQF
jgi:iron complex outermembrane receptor protein